MDKKELRRNMRERMAALEPEYVRESDAGILKNIVSLPEYAAANTIFMYYSDGPEPDTREFLKRVTADGKTAALPRVLGGGEMAVLAVKDPEELEVGSFGLLEPPETAERVAPEDIDFVVVPAVAFDRDGYRLGRGGGYYDRFLERVDAFTVGLAREELLLDAVPREVHDMPVMCLVTEKAAVRFSRS